MLFDIQRASGVEIVLFSKSLMVTRSKVLVLVLPVARTRSLIFVFGLSADTFLR
jgi:hypothetical protein